jgi:putative transposase
MFLPAYSPDFNPIERIWWYMRKKITNNRYVDVEFHNVVDWS